MLYEHIKACTVHTLSYYKVDEASTSWLILAPSCPVRLCRRRKPEGQKKPPGGELCRETIETRQQVIKYTFSESITLSKLYRREKRGGS